MFQAFWMQSLCVIQNGLGWLPMVMWVWCADSNVRFLCAQALASCLCWAVCEWQLLPHVCVSNKMLKNARSQTYLMHTQSDCSAFVEWPLLFRSGCGVPRIVCCSSCVEGGTLVIMVMWLKMCCLLQTIIHRKSMQFGIHVACPSMCAKTYCFSERWCWRCGCFLFKTQWCFVGTLWFVSCIYSFTS